MQVVTLRALTDNYMFLLLDEAAPESAVVDPSDAAPILEYLKRNGLRLTAILNTHHHWDHVGGNQALLERSPGIPVFGSAADRSRIPGQSVFLKEGDVITVSGARANVLDVPGHTRAHVSYYFAAGRGSTGDLFSGDTVFGGTIGNLFEETPKTMFRSIQKIRALPPLTRIWCAHEYTLQYVRESAGIDPGNTRLAQRLKRLEASALTNPQTVPLLLDEECATNPFFRWDDPRLAAHLAAPPGIGVFLRLCEIT